MTQGLDVLRRQTNQFIAENPSCIIILRTTKVPDGAGGYTMDTVPLDEQTVRIVEQQAADRSRTTEGSVVAPVVKMMCSWDADVQRKDQFYWKGAPVFISWITDTGYAKTCEVSLL